MPFSICWIEIEELFRNPGPFYGPVLQQARPRRKRSEIDNLMSLNCWLPDCQKQLSESRENVEQLEGFQNQELAKVKHMLLSAETALDQERRRRKELEESSPSKTGGGEDVEELRKKLQELEVRLPDGKTNLSYRYGQHNNCQICSSAIN